MSTITPLRYVVVPSHRHPLTLAPLYMLMTRSTRGSLSPSMDIKAATRAETRRIMEKQIMKREECKNRMLAERARLQQIVCTHLSPRRAWYAVATYRDMPCCFVSSVTTKSEPRHAGQPRRCQTLHFTLTLWQSLSALMRYADTHRHAPYMPLSLFISLSHDLGGHNGRKTELGCGSSSAARS